MYYQLVSLEISRGPVQCLLTGLAAGICGSISAHSASVTLLAYRCPSRSYFRRVISLHIVCLDDCLTQPSYHNRLKSLISFSVSLSEAVMMISKRGSQASRSS